MGQSRVKLSITARKDMYYTLLSCLARLSVAAPGIAVQAHRAMQAPGSRNEIKLPRDMLEVVEQAQITVLAPVASAPATVTPNYPQPPLD